MQSALALLLVSATVCAVYGQSEYKSAYAVSDPLTGDHKSQKEIGVAGGDIVTGQYKTLDADGLMRTVTYKADPLFGFRADVDRSPAAIAPARIFKRQAILAADPLIGSIASPAMAIGGLYRSPAIIPSAGATVSAFSTVNHARPVMLAAAPSWSGNYLRSSAFMPTTALDWESSYY